MGDYGEFKRASRIGMDEFRVMPPERRIDNSGLLGKPALGARMREPVLVG